MCAFEPYVFHTLKFVEYSGASEMMNWTPADLRTLTRNVRTIRSLEINVANAPKLAIIALTNLLTLSSRWEKDQDLVPDGTLQVMLKLAQGNPGLKELRIDDVDTLGGLFLGHIQTSQFWLQLTTLKLRLNLGSDPYDFFQGVARLPNSVRVLEVNSVDWYFDQDWIRPSDELELRFEKNQLVRFSFTGETIDSKLSDLFLKPFLKHCPNLLDLVLCNIDSPENAEVLRTINTYLERLERLRLNPQSGSYYIGDEACSFDLIQLQLKFLRIDMRNNYENMVFSTLEGFASDSLEELRLENMEHVPDEWVEHLIERCPKLRELRFRPNYSYQSMETISSSGLGARFSHGSESRATPTVLSQSHVRVLPQLSSQSISQFVTENNAFLFAKNLLLSFENLDQLHTEQESGNLDALQSTVATALQVHPDPPTFIANTLITVGTVSGFKELSKDFELEVSKVLVNILCIYIGWRRENDHLTKDNTGAEIAPTTSVSPASSRFFSSGYSSDVSSTSDSTIGSSDLIDARIKIGSKSKMAMMMSPIQHQITSQSQVDLLDTNKGEDPLLDMKPLQPAFGTLIDLSGSEKTSPAVVPSSTFKIPTPSILFGPSSVSAAVSLIDLDDMNDFLNRHERGPNGQETKNTELLEMFDEYYSPVATTTQVSALQQLSAAGESEILINDVPRASHSDSEVHEKLPVPHIIQHHHQEKLLAEIRVCKNVLPVFAALDVFELRSAMRRRIHEGDKKTYGESLERHLYEMGRYRECATFNSIYHDHAASIRRELIPRLLEGDDDDSSDVVLEFVGDNVGLCRTVLWHINHQLIFQFYYWGLITPEISKSDPEPFLEIPPIHGVGKSRIQARLVETAMALIMQFDLEQEQESFLALHFFVRFCTIVSLLRQSAAMPFTKGCSSPSSSSSLKPRRNKLHEYSLYSPTKFFPIVLGLIKESVTLQQMTLQYCMAKRDHQTADYFISRLRSLGTGGAASWIHQACSISSWPSSMTMPAQALDPIAKHLCPTMEAHLQENADKMYQLAASTHIQMIDSIEGLERMSNTLQRAKILALDTEWLPNIAQFKSGQQKNRLDRPRTSIVQIASDVDNSVYLVDVITLMSRGDLGLAFVTTLGSLLNTKSVRKLAFDWDNDQDMLEKTFEELSESHYQPANLLDLKQVWLPMPDDSGESERTTATMAPEGTTTTNSIYSDATLTNTAGIRGYWSTTPSLKGMTFVHGGLSKLLSRLCGVKLDKTLRCSNWEQRPLTEAQKMYAAADAQCLLEIYAELQMMKRI
ncbi:Exonuclease mut-7 [Gryganskiella cystojenkinii]|nr:Exonuclease mut-7 [Gryganskiella cystojenkinii]